MPSYLKEKMTWDFWEGHSTNFLPVRVETGENLHNEIKRVKFLSIEKNIFVAKA